MKSKKSRKMVQKTNIKINIGTSKPNQRRRRRSKTQTTNTKSSPYYHLPMYTVQHGTNNFSRDEFSSMMKQTNDIYTKQFTDLLKDQENSLTAKLEDQGNQITSKITDISEMKTPEFKIPKEYLKLSDLKRFYMNFKERDLQEAIKDILKEEQPIKTLYEIGETKADAVPTDKPELTFTDPDIKSFTPLEEDDLFNDLMTSGKKRRGRPSKGISKKKEPKMTRAESAANARAIRSAKIKAKKESEIEV
jgi:hypothetical protein